MPVARGDDVHHGIEGPRARALELALVHWGEDSAQAESCRDGLARVRAAQGMDTRDENVKDRL